MADVAMGFLFVQAADWQWMQWWDSWTLAMLLLASSLLYIAGVVLNDVFDLEIDRQERPERPLPSGRISLAGARRLGWNLLFSGVLAGTATGFFVGHLRPGIIAALLAICIVLYDAWLKRTPIGPLAMGACRMLNVFLGMTVMDAAFGPEQWLVAGGTGRLCDRHHLVCPEGGHREQPIAIGAFDPRDDFGNRYDGQLSGLVRSRASGSGGRSATLVLACRIARPVERLAVLLGSGRADFRSGAHRSSPVRAFDCHARRRGLLRRARHVLVWHDSAPFVPRHVLRTMD